MLKKLLTPFKPLLEGLLRIEVLFARCWVSAAHRRLMKVQWALAPQPEHFDHHIDLFYQFLAGRNGLFVERGVFGGLALLGGDVLELACGDGFNARNFYSLRSRSVLACDFDPRAIATANRKNKAPNLRFVLADIRTDMPEGIFGNIMWDAAIEHFTLDETSGILADIKKRLTPEGVLSGYTIVEQANGKKMLSHHEYEFKSSLDLRRVLAPFFNNVRVFQTRYPERTNLYFWASDGAIPFSDSWTLTG